MVKRRAGMLTPNGKEIRRLRQAKGKTQQDIVSEGGITQRTLQRAEQGIPVGSQHLTIIAERLEVAPEQIIKDATNSKQAEAYQRVVRLHVAGGRQLIGWLRPVRPFGPALRYLFHVDPNSEESELIAGVIEYCGLYRDSGLPNVMRDPADQIRAIGVLNDKLKELAQRQIGVFAMRERIWDVTITEVKHANVSVWIPDLKTQVLIAFGPVCAPFVEERRILNFTKESIYEHCARLNLEAGIQPEIIEELQYEQSTPDFAEFYKASWSAAQDDEEPADVKLLTRPRPE
jgi:transcriptional regulator with XRE-family HTH domain